METVFSLRLTVHKECFWSDSPWAVCARLGNRMKGNLLRWHFAEALRSRAQDFGTGPKTLRTIQKGSSMLLRRLSAFIDDGSIHSDQFQSVHRASAGTELISLDAKPLEHRYEQLRERVVVLRVEGEVLAVPEAAAGEEHG